MPNLAIIPARGGSKRIPRKNIKDFHGRPIISYSIEIAISSCLFDEVMVSTDDMEIAELSKGFGAKVPFLRSEKTADDFATTMDVLNEVYEKYKSDIGKSYDNICCIYPTAPLIQIQHLKVGLESLLIKNFDTFFPVVEFTYPIWRGLSIDESGKSKMVWPEYLNMRSQDLNKVYHDAGQWYWYKPENVKESLFTENSGSLILSEMEVQDIDDETDWKVAELKYKLLIDARI